jgi:WD repeat-containing protein 42A
VDSLQVVTEESIDDSSEEEDTIDLTPQSTSNAVDPSARVKEGSLDMNVLCRYTRHTNVRTVKEVNFYGARDEYVISGSDDGNIYFWETSGGRLVHVVNGDRHIVNCLAPHPRDFPIIATSGIENDVKIWYPTDPLRTDSRFVDGEIIKKGNEGNEEDPFTLSRGDLFQLLELLAARQPGRSPQDILNQFMFEDDTDEEDEIEQDEDEIEEDE